jgi:hypothetical protein
MGDVPCFPRSFNIVDMGNRELGLSGYPRAPLLRTGWGQVARDVDMACSWVATMHRLLKETLTMVGRDVLQPARVSPKTRRKSVLYLVFSCPSPPT